MRTKTEKTESKTMGLYNAAVRQRELLQSAIAAIVDLQQHKFYPIGHYSKEIKLLRTDLKAIESFLAT